MKQPELKQVDKRAELEMSQLYHGLAKDAFRTANRQYHYSKGAWGEKKYSDEDRKFAIRRGLTVSVLDDEHESQICKEFSEHRKKIADLYYELGIKYDKEAHRHLKLAGRR